MSHGPDPVYVLRGSQGCVTCLKYQTSVFLYSGDQQGFVYVWDLKIKRPVCTLTAHPGHSVLWIEFVNDKTMITQGRDGTVQFWDKIDDVWSKSDTFKSTSLGYCSCVMMNNSTLAVPSDDVSIVELYDIKSKQCLGQLKPDTSGTKYGMCMAICDVKDKAWILVGYENGCVAVWDAKTFILKSITKLHPESVMCCAYDTPSNTGVSGSADDKLISWSISEIGCIELSREITTTNPGFSHLSIRDDGRIFAAAGWDSNIRIFTLKKLKPLAVLSYHKESVQFVAFSMDKTLAGGSKDSHISLWEIYKS